MFGNPCLTTVFFFFCNVHCELGAKQVLAECVLDCRVPTVSSIFTCTHTSALHPPPTATTACPITDIPAHIQPFIFFTLLHISVHLHIRANSYLLIPHLYINNTIVTSALQCRLDANLHVCGW